MNFGILKKARIIISLVFFLLITFIFIDFANVLSGKLIQSILYLQFIPALLDFISLAGLAAIGFIFIILLNLLFGRIYCSTLCPLGTFQDIVIWFKRRFSKKKRMRYQRPFHFLQYGILTLAVLFLLLGLIMPLLMLDPYSNYGRIVANLVRPVFLLVNNLGARILESMDVYTLYRVEPGVTHWFSIAFSGSVFVVVVWLSVKYARLFCNTLCPVGAFLGLLSRVSYFRIRLDKGLCTACGKCSAVCKAGCIDVKSREVDFSRCVGCLNCLSSCPTNGVVFSSKARQPKAEVKPFDPARRELIGGVLGAAATMASLPLQAQQNCKKGKHKGVHEVIREYPVTPPGSGSLQAFNEACTACHLCVSACPTHVIKPAFGEYGLAGIMQARMDYHANYCNFDCVVCTEVCPTGALRPVSMEDKHLLQLGKVEFIKQNCIVYVDGTDCGACSEHCPTKAVNMKPFRRKLFLPVINPDICVGCGACEYACPTDPKSIFVQGNPVHLVADKPKIEELEQPDVEEDFPF